MVIGQTQYVDDFIDQLIGHNTNDSFDITVTFPDDYHQTELRGKDAVFAITINAISVTGLPQITDDFVAQNLAANYGWTTVAEMNETVQAGLSRDSRLTFVRDYLLNQIPVKDIPDSVMEYQKQSMLSYYQSQADSYGLALNDYVSQALGLADVDELVQEAETDLRNAAIYSLASQAVAEAAAITVSEQEVSDYFLETTGSEDYSLYAEQDGMPYLKQVVLWNKVVALIIDLAVSE